MYVVVLLQSYYSTIYYIIFTHGITSSRICSMLSWNERE